jgi:hypothetical protein
MMITVSDWVAILDSNRTIWLILVSIDFNSANLSSKIVSTKTAADRKSMKKSSATTIKIISIHHRTNTNNQNHELIETTAIYPNLMIDAFQCTNFVQSNFFSVTHSLQ